jgi:hypothetical protein
MKVIKIIGIGVVALLVIVFAAGFLLPAKVHVERSVVINKPQDEVFHFLTDYRNFVTWSPWHAIDPKTQYEFSGAESGVGAKMSWQSTNPQVDKGWQEITAIQGQEVVKIKLVFGNESGGGDVYYRLASVAEGTSVLWQFDTDFGNNPFGRYIGLLMDDMLGPYYEKGLAKLKAELEQ